MGGLNMGMQKLSNGVLRVLTPLGPRYLKPSLLQRFYLLWIFRNFHTLPAKVLTPRQQRRIDAICAQRGFISLLEPNGLFDTPLLGTLEQRPALEPQTPVMHRRRVADAVSPFATDRQQSS